MASDQIDDFISESLAQLTKVSPEVREIERNSPTRWAVIYDCTQENIDISLDANHLRIVLRTGLGALVTDESLPHKMAAMLTFNLMWRETGGLWIGSHGPKMESVMMASLRVQDLTLSALPGLLEVVKMTAAPWRDIASGSTQLGGPKTNSEHVLWG